MVVGTLVGLQKPMTEQFISLKTTRDGLMTAFTMTIFSGWYKVLERTIGQFTGLYDKNGEEIYEGDILRSNEYPYYSDIDQYYAVIFWSDEKAAFCLETVRSAQSNVRGCSEGDISSLEDMACYQVIGNIHDDNKLIK